MQYSSHSGNCCGISVVYDFDLATLANFESVIHRHDNERDHGAPGNRLLEAVLTDRQLDSRDPSYNNSITQSVRDAGGWAAVLASHGFVLQTRFQNSNSGRYCNVFHRVSRREPITGLRWQDHPLVAVPVQAPETAVPAPEVAPEPVPETVWSTSYLDSVVPFVGLRVQYRHRAGMGTSERLHNRTGVITRIDATDATIEWDDVRGDRYTYRRNRFVWDTAQLPDPAMTAAEPEPVVESEPEPEPVITRTTEYYAIRRDGTRAGPFESEQQARQRWSRVRQYIRRTITSEDGVVTDDLEEYIAA